MAEFGKSAVLTIVKITDFGPFVDGGGLGEILIPKVFLEKTPCEGDEIEVFIYKDGLGRLTATPKLPLARTGEFACLRCKAATDVGAFLDWGLPQDLFVPFREQREKMKEGKDYLVYIYHDTVSDRLAATSRIDFYLNDDGDGFSEGQKVELLIAYKTDLGFKAIINKSHSGVLYFNEVFRKLKTGDHVTGFIKGIREDGKIDLTLNGPDTISALSETIFKKLKAAGGSLPLSDKSSPKAIAEAFGVSKKQFKKAIGILYKQRKIVIEKDFIRLV